MGCERDPDPWTEDGDRERLEPCRRGAWKDDTAVRLLRTGYKGGTERSLSPGRSLCPAPATGWDLMGAHCSGLCCRGRAMASPLSSCLPVLALLWSCCWCRRGGWSWDCQECAGKAQPESLGCWDEGVRWAWEGACGGHGDSG